MDLRLHARGKEKVDSWERQIPFRLEVNGVLICKYVVDFHVHYADGRHELVEVKGYPTKDWLLKKKLFEALVLKDHPEIIYTIQK